MKLFLLIAILASFACQSVSAQLLEKLSRIDIPLTKRSLKFGYNMNFAEWVSDNAIVAFTRDCAPYVALEICGCRTAG